MVRRHGRIATPDGLGVSDHVCWAYESEEERLEGALAWLDDGWWLGQRLFYTADKPADALKADLAALGDVEELIATGALIVVPSRELYDMSAPIDGDRQLAVYAAAVDEACAAGYQGIRVVADITPLVADPARRAAHARWEHQADRWIAAGNPAAPMCAYDRVVIEGADVDDICALHPLANRNGVHVPFHLFGQDDGLALDGEVDGFAAAALERLLKTAVVADGAPVDLSEVEFVDHHGVLALARHARETGAPLTGAPPYVKRLWEALQVERAYGVPCP